MDIHRKDNPTMSMQLLNIEKFFIFIIIKLVLQIYELSGNYMHKNLKN